MSEIDDSMKRHYGGRQEAMSELGLWGQDLDDFVGENGTPDAITCRPPRAEGSKEVPSGDRSSVSDGSRGNIAMAGAEIDFPPNVFPGIN